MTGADLVAEARGWLGVPWRHMGRSRAGVDCIGLVLLSARACGFPVDDPAPYTREPQGMRLLDGVAAQGRRVTEAAPGDLLLFRLGAMAAHLGIATLHPDYGVPAVLHAYAPRRRVVEEPITPDLQAALLAIIRITED